MELKELLLFRNQLLDDSRDDDGYISDDGILDKCLPMLNDTRYIDSTDVTGAYDPLEGGAIKVNAYLYNESGERLQLFLVNEESINPGLTEDQLVVSQKVIYDKQMNRALTFVKKSVKKQLNELLHDASPAWVLAHQLSTPDSLGQIDVVEIFLISLTATVQTRGATPTPKELEFEEDTVTVGFIQGGQKQTKDITVIKRLIDLNFMYNVQMSEGSRYPLVIDFTIPPFHPVPFLHAAKEKHFDSYLCALPATLLAELYKKYSSRLLEKNVRSFLQLKGVNKGMQETIRLEPEKFIAYNNGLTITATAGEIENYQGVKCIKSLSDFQIVNGGQTTATIYFSRKGGLPIEGIQVMAKINVAKNASEEILDELISKISVYSNAQSRVSKVDLRARSTQLVKLKSLSESVLTVSGKKWFFERAKGEYATMMRINSAKKVQLEKTYPRERRFTKEDLAKYFSAWGDKPYLVKKGGEKVFRLFLEEISGEGGSSKAMMINRNFYEDLIARIILFRSLEKIYGQGSGAIGQIRSAVVPYSISAIYQYTSSDKKGRQFDLLKIWKAEKLENDLHSFFRDLMKLMNRLIRRYSQSDDLGEYSKKQELWDNIADSQELQEFMNRSEHKSLIKKYCISADEAKKREKEASKEETLDFGPLLYAAEMFDRGASFYWALINQDKYELTESQLFKLKDIASAIVQNRSIDLNHIEFEKELLKSFLTDCPELLAIDESSDLFRNTVGFIIKKYNAAFESGSGIKGEFDLLKELAKKKGVSYYPVFSEIGKSLHDFQLPTMQQIIHASEYIKA
ncbi:MAG: AIPR family protein [Puia sp.]|nr:AIPR family protein [Puia sp.]